MPEWSIGAVSKTVEPFGVPRVRIPLSPPSLAEARQKKGEGELRSDTVRLNFNTWNGELRRTQSACFLHKTGMYTY